jgi:hypothetical protein
MQFTIMMGMEAEIAEVVENPLWWKYVQDVIKA